MWKALQTTLALCAVALLLSLRYGSTDEIHESILIHSSGSAYTICVEGHTWIVETQTGHATEIYDVKCGPRRHI